MTRTMRGHAVALATMLILAAPALAKDKQPAPDPADEVKAVELARGDALLKADTTALAKMTAEEFVEINRFGLLRSKADNLHDVGAGILKLATVKYDSLTVSLYGDVAILRGIADNTGSFRGMPFAGKIRYTRIFVRRDHRWQAVAMQHTPMP